MKIEAPTIDLHRLKSLESHSSDESKLLRSTAFTAVSAGCDLSNRRRRRRDDAKLVATERRLEAWAWLVAEDAGVQTS